MIQLKRILKKQKDGKNHRKLLITAVIIIASFVTLLIINDIFVAAMAWLSDIWLGIWPIDASYTETQKSQIILGGGLTDSIVLILILRFWIRKRKARFWKFMRLEMLILIPIYLVGSLGISSYLFIKGQQGGDYGCGQEVSLDQAYQATYPITTDTGGGSAFAINNHGTLLTAYHVIKGAKTITEGLDGTGSKLAIIKTNPKYDVALLKYNHSTPDYIPLTSIYNVTDQVFLLGWPDNVDINGEMTITSGIISRDISSQDANSSGDSQPSHMSFIQTDAATNDGNSGGPLVDTCGAVGMMDSSSTDQNGSPQPGINYAISSSAIKYALGLK